MDKLPEPAVIEETAQVVRVENDAVWVETLRRSTCSGCAAENGCGSAALSKVLGRRRTVLRVLSDLPLQAGDRVVIGVAERALVRGSLAVYAVPLLLLLLGAVIGELGVARGLWDDGEIASLTAGLIGLAVGLLWLRRFTRNIQNDHRYQPVVLRRVDVLPAERMALQ